MKKNTDKPGEIEIASLRELLNQHDDGMSKLFARALNIYAAPDMEGVPDKERLDRLRHAVDESLK